jgi:hypothetical protein
MNRLNRQERKIFASKSGGQFDRRTHIQHLSATLVLASKAYGMVAGQGHLSGFTVFTMISQ